MQPSFHSKPTSSAATNNSHQEPHHYHSGAIPAMPTDIPNAPPAASPPPTAATPFQYRIDHHRYWFD